MKTTTTIINPKKVREVILEGVNAIYEPVRKTFGPEGHNVLLYRTFNRGSRITNDGVTVAECQEPRDPSIRLVATTFKEACKRTNEKVGDGTTATTIIAGALMNIIHKLLTNSQSQFVASQKGVGVMTLKKNILDAAKIVKEKIKASARKIETLEDLEKIATVSVEDQELGKTIAKMAWEVGVDGFIDVVEGYKGEIETEIIKGMRFPAKVPTKSFVNNPARYEMVALDCPVFVTNYALDNAGEVAQIFQKFNSVTSKLIVIAPSFSDNVLINMVNAIKQGYFIYPVNAPSLRTEQFEDLATYCGAIFIDKNKGKLLKNVVPQDLGFLEKLIVKDTEAKEDATAIGGAGEREEKMKVGKEEYDVSSPIAERIKTLKAQLEETREDIYKKLLERRIASMASSVGIIRVGDSTQASSLYRKLKIEDAVYASKAALRGGYVKGGGLCLKEIAESEDSILKEALLAPYEQIQSSVEGGIDISNDIIDPCEAIYYAVEHATQVVANLATVASITVENEDPIHGEGEFAIAKALAVLAVNDKIHKAQIKESEREANMDMMMQSFGVPSYEEASHFDRG